MRWSISLLFLLALGPPALADPLEISSRRLFLNPEEPTQQRVGELVFKGGLALSSDDDRFGGFSGLVLSNGNLVAVSDKGYWLTARLVEEKGRLAGLSEARISAMLDRDDRALGGKKMSDAEAVERRGDGFVVSFERRHRIWLYPGAKPHKSVPQALPPPPGLGRAPRNGGIEALAPLPGGGLLVLTEGLAAAGGLRGWHYDGQNWLALIYQTTGQFKPTDLAALPGGGFMVLERRYTTLGGPAARLQIIAGITPGAPLIGREIATMALPLTVDNMGGLAVVPTAAGLAVYLLSDDNFHPLQRTLLMKFELARN
ncbi:MAG: esterase-like activity of phytase family protein [Alphaproteobacteria bacterium]|jgi:hypothetical protein|nr:esterase-like activity of phytase family protein [Alphaproteobacteria bacterium]|tara:strand:- start:1697 stop:2638 length:942 start_codon:yes stop_codon:yes gene_type:complete